MVHAGGVHGGGVHGGGGVMLTLATPHSRRCWQLFLRLSPYSRSSPFSGTALSQALSTPAGRAFPFRTLRPAGRSRSAQNQSKRLKRSGCLSRQQTILRPGAREGGVRAVVHLYMLFRLYGICDMPLFISGKGRPGLAPVSHCSPNLWIWDCSRNSGNQLYLFRCGNSR
jgi:hypothetical protein